MGAGEYNPIRSAAVFFDKGGGDFSSEIIVGNGATMKRIFRITCKTRSTHKSDFAIASKIADECACVITLHCAFGGEHRNQSALRTFCGGFDRGYSADNRN